MLRTRFRCLGLHASVNVLISTVEGIVCEGLSVFGIYAMLLSEAHIAVGLVSEMTASGTLCVW